MSRSRSAPRASWFAFSRDLALLGVEAAEVMTRRCLVLAKCDGRAVEEFALMVGEKAQAVAELQLRLATGGLGRNPARTALSHVRRKVRANRARLRR